MAFWHLWFHSLCFLLREELSPGKQIWAVYFESSHRQGFTSPFGASFMDHLHFTPLVWTKLHPVLVFVLSLAHCVFRWISALVFSCFHITSDVQLLHLASFFTDAQIHHTGIAIWFFCHLLFKKYLFIFGSLSLEESSLQLVGLVSLWHVGSSSLTRDWTLHWKLNCQPLYHQGSPSPPALLGGSWGYYLY